MMVKMNVARRKTSRVLTHRAWSISEGPGPLSRADKIARAAPQVAFCPSTVHNTSDSQLLAVVTWSPEKATLSTLLSILTIVKISGFNIPPVGRA